MERLVAALKQYKKQEIILQSLVGQEQLLCNRMMGELNTG